jgi:hypothetical protein
MAEIPTEIKIPDHLYNRLMKANDNVLAVNTMMEMFQKNCEAKIAQHNSEMRQIWQQIGAECNLNVEDIVWAPRSDKPGVIAPIQMRIVNASPTPNG